MENEIKYIVKDLQRLNNKIADKAIDLFFEDYNIEMVVDFLESCENREEALDCLEVITCR